MKHFFLIFFILICANACTNETNEKASQEDGYSHLPLYFVKTLQSHGGLDKWKEFRTLTYTLFRDTDSLHKEHYTLDLQTRKDLIRADSFRIGYDGTNVWVAPHRSAFPGKSARFYHSLWGYFLSIPFVLADPGTHHTEDSLTIDGKLYDAIKVRFGKGIGDSHQDTYVALVNPITHRMEKLLYTVTYYAKKESDAYNILFYEDWKKIDGIWFPHKLSEHKYLEGKTGEKRYEITFTKVAISKQPVNPSIFEIPEGASLDSLITF